MTESFLTMGRFIGDWGPVPPPQIFRSTAVSQFIQIKLIYINTTVPPPHFKRKITCASLDQKKQREHTGRNVLSKLYKVVKKNNFLFLIIYLYSILYDTAY